MVGPPSASARTQPSMKPMNSLAALHIVEYSSPALPVRCGTSASCSSGCSSTPPVLVQRQPCAVGQLHRHRPCSVGPRSHRRKERSML
eukprot:SAG11_NODE_16531_length_545_cov_0.573991_2_plen_87_part_01